LFVSEATTSLSSFAPDATSIVSSIKYHAEFTPLSSPEKFELPQAYIATAQTTRDALLINWNATYDYYEKLNVKQAYYLSMEFLQVGCHLNDLNISEHYWHLILISTYHSILQGRALLNAIGNLELTGPYAEALSQLGYKLENVAHQVWHLLLYVSLFLILILKCGVLYCSNELLFI
jgi:starch phosphorylase